MITKISEVVYIHQGEEIFIDQVIIDYENRGYRLVLEKEIVGECVEPNTTWMLGFAKREEKFIR